MNWHDYFEKKKPFVGDVDSGDENEVDEAHVIGSEMPPHPHAVAYAYGNPNRLQSPFRGWGLPNQHETKL